MRFRWPKQNRKYLLLILIPADQCWLIYIIDDSVTNQDALQPVVEVPHEEDSASTPHSQANFLQAVVVTRYLHTVISNLTDQ